MHYKSEDEAREKWERRKSRIDRSRLIFKLSQREGCSDADVREFLALPVKNKICFSHTRAEGAIYVPELEGLSGSESDLFSRYFDDTEYLNSL